MAVSQPSLANCTLDVQLLSSSSFPVFEGEEDWGGFLHNKSCAVAFHAYLFALAKRANQTGQIYQSSSEQRKCLNSMKSFGIDVSRCGMDKLVRGVGGCSEFSVEDVTSKLGDELRRLNENCENMKSDRESEHSCSSCVRAWENISGRYSMSADNNSKIVETDICRFAVLVSLTSSKIEETVQIQALDRCLGAQNVRTGNHDQGNSQQTSEGKRKTISSQGNSPPSSCSLSFMYSKRATVHPFHSKAKAIFMQLAKWILVGGIIGIMVIGVISTVVLLRCHSKSSPPRKRDERDERDGSDGRDAFEVMFQEEPDCLQVPIEEVYSATGHLSELNFIGEGTTGKVYKGILSNNRHVAIKHIINDGNVKPFVREVTSLSRVKHPNLVALLGYCVKEGQCFLIYELCPNGNLSKWLFGKENVLTWIQRLEIAVDSARGLWFLHTYPEGCIVHRDIKPTNILLGANFEAKLSDLGLSRVIDGDEKCISSEVRGTFGYVDPEYRNNQRLQSSVDVYSFGVVLLQILSAKRAVNLSLKKPTPLRKMAEVVTRGGSVAEFADPKLDGEYSVEAFELTLQLALSCTSLKKQRPSMEQVVKRLEEAIDISTGAKASAPAETSPEQS